MSGLVRQNEGVANLILVDCFGCCHYTSYFFLHYYDITLHLRRFKVFRFYLQVYSDICRFMFLGILTFLGIYKQGIN